MNQEVFSEVKAILETRCEVEEEINPETVIQDNLGLDSIGLVTFAVAIEETYDLRLDEVEEPPVTLEDLVRLIDAKMNPA